MIAGKIRVQISKTADGKGDYMQAMSEDGMTTATTAVAGGAPVQAPPRDIEGFVSEVWRSMCSGGEMDSDDFFDLAEVHGVSRTEPFDPENPAHQELDWDYEPGDPVYFLRAKEDA